MDEDRTQEAAQIATGEALPTPDEPTQITPSAAYSPAAAPPTIVYQMAPQTPARAPKVSKPPLPAPIRSLDRLFPAQDERIVVYRKRADGPPDGTYIGTYQASDLAGCVTIEQFLDKYVRPKLADGYGDYIVKMIEATGQVRKSGLFSLEAQAETGSRHPPRDPLVETAVELLHGLAHHRSGNGVSPAQIDELRQLLAGNTALGADSRAILDRLDSIARGLQPKEENVERVLLLKLLKKVEDMGLAPPSSLPSLSSSALPVDPVQIAREVAREVADAMGKQTSVVDLIMAIQKLQPQQPVVQPPPPQQDAIQQLTAMMTLVDKMGGGKELDYLRQKLDRFEQILTQPNEQPGPLETIQQVVQVAESLEKLGARRVERTGPGSFGAYVRDIFAGIPEVAREIGTLVDKAKQREILTTRRIMLERSKPAATRSTTQPTVQPAAQPMPEEDPYGPNFAPFLSAVVAADDDRARIKTTLTAFRYLGQNEPWRAFYDKTVRFARARDRQAITLVAGLLDNLRKTGKLSEAQRGAIVSAFEKNWDAIVDRVFGAPPTG